MITNGITIPDEGTSKQYIIDQVGGWLYVVTTIVTRDQQRLDQAQAHVDDMKAQIADLQATVAELEPVTAELAAAIPASAPVSLAPSIKTASSTPMI